MNIFFTFKHGLLLLVLFSSLGSYATAEISNREITIIIPGQAQPYKTIVESIKKEITNGRKIERVKVLNLKTLKQSPQRYLKDTKLVILIGTKALGFYISSNIKIPFVASFTTQSAFTSLTVKASRQPVFRKIFVGGVSLEQPPYRFVRLAKLIKPNLKSIGVVLGPNSQTHSSAIHSAVSQLGSRLNVVNIRANDNPVKKLRGVFKKSQLLIIFPDKAKFNRSLARWVIALSYKQQVPVISYSKKYADAGALISLYSKPQQIGKQTAEIILAYLHQAIRTKQLVAPKYFNLTINESVKQALNLSLPPKDELLKKLYRVAP